MKAFLNPLLLVVCILLLAFGYVADSSGQGAAPAVETWVLTLCLLGVIINGTLGVARALTARPSVQAIGWAVGFLIFGCTIWALVSADSLESLSAQERARLHEQVQAWEAGQLEPWVADENGDSIITLAAGLGKVDLLREVVMEGVAICHPDVLARAAHRAAERDRAEVLEYFSAKGYISANTRLDGQTLLHTAALCKARRAALWLLGAGADANAVAEADGATPLHKAVLAEDAAMARLLLQHGANPALPDADGRDAASYARTEGVISALEEAAPRTPAPAAP